MLKMYEKRCVKNDFSKKYPNYDDVPSVTEGTSS